MFFYVFYSGHVRYRYFTFFDVFFIFSRIFKIFFKKTLSKAKYEYAKIQQKTEDVSAMIFFIDFGLLCSPYCKISYLLAEER